MVEVDDYDSYELGYVVTGQTPTAPGSFSFSMRGDGQTASSNETLTVTVPPSGNVPIEFQILEALPGVTFNWQSNGTTISSLQTFTYRFGNGQHNIKVDAYNFGRYIGTANAVIQVKESTAPAPTARISISGQGQSGGNNSNLRYTVSPAGSVNLFFDGTGSSGDIVKYEWRSNGGAMHPNAPSMSQLNFPFAAASHTITLTVTNSAGLTDTATALIVVTESETPTTNPRAVISMASPDGQTGSNGSTLNYQVVPPGSIKMSFNASGSQAGASNIAKYEWFSNNTFISNLPTFNFLFGVGANSNSTSHTIKLRVTNSANLTDETTATIIVNATTSPVINSISPSTPATIVGDQSVTVQGGNFQPNLQVVVTFPNGQTGRLSGAQIRYGNATQFAMLISFNGNPGNYAIRVENPDGSRSNDFRFSVQPQTLSPTINAISPASPRATAGDQPIAISGSNFRQGMKIRVTFPNGQMTDLMGAQVSIASETSCSILINFNDNPGTYSFRAINADGKESNLFPVTAQPPVQKPAITSISPASPVATGDNQNITVTGSNFQSGIVAVLTSPSGQSFPLSGGQIQNFTSTQFVAVINFNRNAGGYSLKVRNPDNNESAAYNFTVQAAAPVISSINPAEPIATASSVNQIVTVNGNNFVQGMSIRVTFPNGQTQPLSGSQVDVTNPTTCNVTINFNNIAGQYSFKAIAADGRESNAFSFNVRQAVQSPAISSISPSSPNATSGDQTVAISGSNFQSGLVVVITFPNGQTGTLVGSQVRYVNSGSAEMIVNFNGNPGTYRIVVRNPDGRESGSFSFTVQSVNPSISSISPATPSRAAGERSVTVNGANFVSGASIDVFFPGGGSTTLSGSQVRYVSSSQLVMTINFNNNGGTYRIAVRNPDGRQSSQFSFTVQ